MRSAVVREIGRPPVPADSPHPGMPGHGEVLVELSAAALNPFDLDVAAGTHPHGRPRTPYVPGVEGVGIVVEGPADLISRRVRVHGAGGFGPGTLAEFVRLPHRACTPVPEALDDPTAAGLGMVGITAIEVLQRAQLTAGETVLVLGATGAVGRATVQVARAMSAGTIIAAGRNEAALHTVGADSVVELTDGRWQDAIADPVDIIVDSLWGEPAAAAMSRLARGGRFVSVGSAAGASAPIEAGALRRTQGTLLGFTMTQLDFDAVDRDYQLAAALVVAGDLHLPLKVHPLVSVEAAWRCQRHSAGCKVVVALPASHGRSAHHH